LTNKRTSTRIATAIVALFWTAISAAQETSVFSDANAEYKKGIELFQQEKFGAAKEKFIGTISRIENSAIPEDHLLLINARYYNALCSKRQEHPDAEKLFLDLVDQFEENPTTRLAYFQLGDIYFDMKRFDRAITYYKKVDTFDLNAEEQLEYEFQLGFCYFYKKDFDKAQGFFDLVKNKQGSYYFPSNYYSGYIAYKQGRYADALNSFKLVEKSEVYKSVVPYYIASISFQQNKYDEVIAYASAYNQAENVPYKIEMQQLIGKAFFEKKQYDKAMPYFTAYMSAKTKLDKSDIYQIAYCQYQAKSYEAAIGSFKELNVLKDSLGQNALYLLGDCYLRLDQKDDARLAFEQASRMQYDDFVKEQSSFQYAKLSYELNYHDVAVNALKEFIEEYPKSRNAEEARQYLTLEFLSTQNFSDALEVLRSMPSKNPQLRQAFQKVTYSRATELYNEKNFVDAIQLFDESLQNPVDPTLQAAAHFWKGEAFYDQKRYGEAIESHSKFLGLLRSKQKLPAGVSELNAHYTMGYAYLKQDEFSKASDQFEQVTKISSAAHDEESRMLYADAVLRLADCSFVLKNYSNATSTYGDVVSKKLTGSDYALYQKAVIQGLQSNNSGKIESLKKMTSEYPSSIYMDDALYELGLTYLTVPSYQEAAEAFNQVIAKYPNSSYVRKAHLKLGLIWFNLGDDSKALEEYKWVLNKYPKTPEGTEALNGVKEIYTEKGDAQGYIGFVKNLPNVNVTDAAKDSVMYLAAETKYVKGDCNEAVRELSAYLNSFADGQFAMQAHFYRGECFLKQNDFQKALTDYEYVADQPQNRFSEKSLLQAARINYSQKKDYEKAYRYYQQLSSQADFKANEMEAFKGMMYSAWYMNRYKDAEIAAGLLLNSHEAKSGDQVEAHYYLGKIAFAENDLSKAFAELSMVSKEKSVQGTEAAYLMGLIYFRQDNLKAAEDQCYVVIRHKQSNDYWIAKSYLLLADIFEREEDYFQAKSTLQSIIDNYKGADDIVATAKEKLSNVQKKEAAQSKLKEDQPDEGVEMDAVPEQN